MEETNTSPQDYLSILNRRKWSLIIPCVSVIIIAILIALLLPPVYKSTSTILIEEQEIPADFVMSTVTSYAQQRLQIINQRIMSSSRLQEIIDRFDLYADRKGKWTNEEIIAEMREDILLEPINVEVVDRRTGRPSTATIAFTLSYEGKNYAEKVYRVANVLASLFLEENIKVREKQVTEASQFFEDEIVRIKLDIVQLEGKISAFKQQHVNELPELLPVNMQSLQNIELNVERNNEQLRSLQERKVYLQTQLASVSPQMEDKQRLEELKLQLINLRSTFSDAYPDVALLKSEIAEIEKQMSEDKDIAKGGVEPPDNPAYINLASQLAGVESELDSVLRQIKELDKQKQELQRRVALTSVVEGEYKALLSERDNTQAKHDDLMRKFMEAKVAQGLEKEQKGERFTLIDPAIIPEKPFRPNRLAIMLIGLVLGIGAGVAYASFREFSDDSVWNIAILTEVTEFPVLAAIPEIITEAEKRALKARQKKRMLIALGAVIVFLLIFHFFIMDFDVLWARLARRLAI